MSIVAWMFSSKVQSFGGRIVVFCIQAAQLIVFLRCTFVRLVTITVTRIVCRGTIEFKVIFSPHNYELCGGAICWWLSGIAAFLEQP